MKKPRRFTISEDTYGLTVEFYVNVPQRKALRRCASVMGMNADDPENAPDETAAAWCMSHGGWALVWIEDWPADQRSLPHELWHVIHGFLRHIESSDEETGAYLMARFDEKARKKLQAK